MADDMKLILRELEKVNLRMDDLRDDLKSEINELRVEMNGKINQMDGKINQMDGKINQMDDKINQMDGKINQMDGKINNLQNSNTRIQLLIENDLSKKIDIIGEGHDFLKMKLDEALLMERKWESMALEQINLRMDVNKLKDHANIA